MPETVQAQESIENIISPPEVPDDLMTGMPIDEIICEPVEARDSTIIEIPIGELHNGYLSNHIEARLSTEKQRKNMRRILNGLRKSGAKLENGRFVDTQADMFKWILEQV
jgi:hypothetical protein